MGRGKIEIKRIENTTNRQVTFSKRRGGLLKKAHELGILCDAQIALVIFSSSGKMYEYCNPPSSMRQIMDRYQRFTNTRIDEFSNQEQIYCEMTRMKDENDKILASMRHYTGEDLGPLTVNDLNQIEQQLEISMSKVRARKQQLLHQQLENLRRKEHLLEDQNSHLCRILAEHQAVVMEHHHQAAVEQKVADMPMLEHYFYPEDPSRNMLPLSPRLHSLRLQPTQPNLQETSLLHGHGLQLW